MGDRWSKKQVVSVMNGDLTFFVSHIMYSNVYNYILSHIQIFCKRMVLYIVHYALIVIISVDSS